MEKIRVVSAGELILKLDHIQEKLKHFSLRKKEDFFKEITSFEIARRITEIRKELNRIQKRTEQIKESLAEDKQRTLSFL